MALRQELPHSFEDALRVAKIILNRSIQLVERGVVDTEAEQLVIAAYRLATGTLLSRVEFFSRMKDRYPEAAGKQIIILAGSRVEGKMLQYLTGTQGFLSHEYEVGPGVLIPRPETEVLLVSALSELDASGSSPTLGLEIGLGSGVLSIELLSHFPALQMAATEISELARSFAEKNSKRILGVGSAGSGRLKILSPQNALDTFQPFDTLVQKPIADFLISNPPYLTQQDSIEVDVMAHEPHEALYAPQIDPLHFYREISLKSPEFLKKKGFVFVELPHERADLILKLFTESKWNAKVLHDLNQRERVLVAKLKE